MMRRAITAGGLSLQRQTIEGVAEKMDSLNPPRSDRDHKHFVDSWFYAVGSVNVGATLPDGIPAGKSLKRANNAAHAAVLNNPGVTKSGPAIGRRIGTPSAPRGYEKPALLHARSRKAAWLRQAIRVGSRHL